MIKRSSYRYCLDPSSKQFYCPNCDKKRFKRYIDQQTKAYLGAEFGRCNRQNSCAYHLKPSGQKMPSYRIAVEKPKPVQFITERFIRRRLSAYQSNSLISWMGQLKGWDLQLAVSIAKKYRVGTARTGAFKNHPIFFITGKDGKCGAGKLMKYNAQTGQRIKEGHSIDSIHAMMERKANPKQSYGRRNHLFGLHLISRKTRTVAVVESEKTAMIASAYMPQYVWVATQSMSNLAYLQAIKDKDIILFPDLGAEAKWRDYTVKMPFKRIRINYTLTELADTTEKKKGLDIADYLIRYNLRQWKNTLI